MVRYLKGSVDSEREDKLCRVLNFKDIWIKSGLSSHSYLISAVMLLRKRFFAFICGNIILGFTLPLREVNAANIKYEFTVDFPDTGFSQPLLGERGSGYLIFDDASSPVLTRTEDIQLDYFEIERLRFSLLGQTFTENDDVTDGRFPFPLVAFGNNRLQGLNYAVNRRNPAGLGFGFQENNSNEDFISASDGSFVGGIGAQVERDRDGFDGNSDAVGTGFSIGSLGTGGLSEGRVQFRRVPLADNVVGSALSLSFGLVLLILKRKLNHRPSPLNRS